MIDLPRKEVYPGGPQHETRSGDLISSNSCFDLKHISSTDLNCKLIIEEFGRDHAKSIYVAYQIAAAKGRFLIGPSDIASEIRMAVIAKDCKGRECGSISPFDILCVQGEGLMVYDANNPPLESIPFVRVHTNSILAQWVALSQTSLFPSSQDES